MKTGINKTDQKLNNDKHFLSEYSKYLDSSGKHLTYAALSTYTNFAEELSQKEKSFLKGHLDSCQSCSSRLREVEEVENEKVHPLPRARRWIGSPVFRYSIAAALVLALGTVVTMDVLRNRHQEQLASQVPSPAQPLAIQALDPERFIANPVLDGFIERTVRSASTTRFRIPHAGDTVNLPIHLEWDATKGPYSLTIVDNKNREVLTMGITETRAVVDTRPVPGLYYAKLEVGGNLNSVTKFYIIARQE